MNWRKPKRIALFPTAESRFRRGSLDRIYTAKLGSSTWNATKWKFWRRSRSSIKEGPAVHLVEAQRCTGSCFHVVKPSSLITSVNSSTTKIGRDGSRKEMNFLPPVQLPTTYVRHFRHCQNLGIRLDENQWTTIQLGHPTTICSFAVGASPKPTSAGRRWTTSSGRSQRNSTEMESIQCVKSGRRSSTITPIASFNWILFHLFVMLFFAGK